MAKGKKNPDAVTMFTPRTVLKWPKLDKVDTGTDKFPDPDGSYNTRAVFDTRETLVQKFLAKLDAMLEVSRKQAEEKFAELPIKTRKQIEAKSGGIAADQPYSIVYDEDTEEDTGKVEMRFKMKASGTRKKDGSKWTAKPALFDAKGKPLKKGIEIWGGSVAIINAEFSPYFVVGTGSYGVMRRLNAVQVIELVSKGERTAASYGFEAQEGFDSDDLEDGDIGEGGSSDDADDDGDDTDF
ncbi:DUF2815 domain-containing protein [Aquibium microcysteis]|uniref:DUF2815 domain-containing protein n=1 Tax=Aquibium microcysteis TaxID=675281 RepID=UPI00165D1787|nr:DUF2815 domain-containing protein [Aquibium microcysteis]